jgi:hypothetical protein
MAYRRGRSKYKRSKRPRQPQHAWKAAKESRMPRVRNGQPLEKQNLFYV